MACRRAATGSSIVGGSAGGTTNSGFGCSRSGLSTASSSSPQSGRGCLQRGTNHRRYLHLHLHPQLQWGIPGHFDLLETQGVLGQPVLALNLLDLKC